MKKKLCRITALLLAAVLSLGGCGQPGAGKKRTDSTQQTEETKNKKVSLDLRYKKERLVGFNLDSESLAKNLNDERFNKIEILITGIDDKSAANRGV